ncbi:MAG: hypothetical protein ACPGSW_06275 [Phaeobacter italicus]
MTRQAWYLGHRTEDVGECAILVGDPDRVARIATLLDAPAFLPVQRGLKTVAGTYNGTKVSVAAFGMGAPIATIVMHELAYLGLTRFVRIGTAMHFPPAVPGDFVISQDALCFEGTSPSYATSDAPPQADEALVVALQRAATARGETGKAGTFATFDAFYRDMFGIDDAGHRRAAQTREMLKERAVLATDMETSALLTAGQALGVACATLCLGTVDGISQEKLAAAPLAAGEQQMFRIALDAITDEG